MRIPPSRAPAYYEGPQPSGAAFLARGRHDQLRRRGVEDAQDDRGEREPDDAPVVAHARAMEIPERPRAEESEEPHELGRLVAQQEPGAREVNPAQRVAAGAVERQGGEPDRPPEASAVSHRQAGDDHEDITHEFVLD